jgi:ATP-dependent helicase/nuclease subunit B
VEPTVLSENNLPETKEAAFSEFCRRINSKNGEGEALYKILENQDIKSRINSVVGKADAVSAHLDKEIARNLFGEKLSMSPTAFESYNGCHFKYFCRYGLGIQKLTPAEFNPAQTGTVVHYVLQRVVEEYGKGISEFSKERIAEETDRFVEEYLSGIEGYKSIETKGMKYQIMLIKRTLRYVIERLAAEFAQSEFEPVHCELKFNDTDGDIPAIKIKADGGEIILSGVVDRVDKWNGYVRIVDYKTGERNFKLPDILYGQNMQMILYLYALKNDEKFGGKASGVFYMKAKRTKQSSPADRRMNGILAYDKSLAQAMDSALKGEFIPKYSDTKQPESYINEEDFDKIFDFVNRKLQSTANNIFSGAIDARPVDSLDGNPCDYCDFASVCRISEENRTKVPSMSREDVMTEIERKVD